MDGLTKQQTRDRIESIRNTVANRLGLHDPTFVAMEDKNSLEVAGSRMDWTGHVRYFAKPLDNAEFGMIDRGEDVTVNEGSDDIYVDVEATVEDGDCSAVCALVVDDETVIRTRNSDGDIDGMMDTFLESLDDTLEENPGLLDSSDQPDQSGRSVSP